MNHYLLVVLGLYLKKHKLQNQVIYTVLSRFLSYGDN